MSKQKLRKFSLLLGLIVAVGILCSQAFHSFYDGGQTVKKEQTDEKGSEDAVVSAAPSITLPTSISIASETVLYCLFEIETSEDEDKVDSPQIGIESLRLMMTLFRFVIAPNAP